MLFAALSYILIDVVLATTALLIGVGCGWLMFRAPHDAASPPQAARTASPPAPAASAPPQTAAAGAPADAAAVQQRVEAACQAAANLQDLTRGVAADVQDHNDRVGNFSSQLGMALETGDSSAITPAIAAMMAANEALRDKLAEAEKKIQLQAEELRNHASEARTDALTQLANRRAFDAKLAELVKLHRTQGAVFSLMLFDVDHFKKFNDAHGHLAGDEVLRTVAGTLRKSTKSSDFACRHGGEEFALLMPGVVLEQAKFATERVRQALEGAEVAFEGQRLKVTASMGIAEFRPDEDPLQLVQRADAAIYAAKKAGRNKSFYHNGADCLPIASLGDGKFDRQPTIAGQEPARPAEPRSSAAAQAALDEAADAPATPRQMPDRRQFADEVARRVAESHRLGSPLSVMHLQVKDYAALENAVGKQAGQLLLDSVAEFILSSIRDMDLLGKYDHDEFVVMLPGSTESEAKHIGRRIKSTLQNCIVPLGASQVRLETHVGISHVQPGDDADALIARSRRVMLAAATLDREVAEVS